MLEFKHISKQYKTGELVQQALDDVILKLRENEFVSILGPSGSGKTTLLNIIGGLDRYDQGDLIIDGVSTRRYRDRDWDSYRNHSIGFVFQSYNLIPHQSILANVELALTISGVSRSERKKRAKKALEKVGLGDQLHKRPNQLSGGQMQRVAIARALVNDPQILLADEPTGALDTQTSLQIMELLKQVAEDRLVVMVTHNPELAETYSTRIVRLCDGKVISDSNPCSPAAAAPSAQKKNPGRAKMSFFTALSLSFNNLRTKKGRTVLTSFAGSIGIIGIALILALSNGVNTYIADLQRDTMTSYPITISAESLDLTEIMGTAQPDGGEATAVEEGKVAASYAELKASESVNASIKENNLAAFKSYLDDPDSEIHSYLGENGAVYTYDVSFEAYARDSEGNLVNTSDDPEDLLDSSGESAFSSAMQSRETMTSLLGITTTSAAAENFTQLMAGSEENSVSPIVSDSYDLVYGAWPSEKNQVVLVLDEDGVISADVLYRLGYLTAQEYKDLAAQIENGEEPDSRTWDYASLCEKTFSLVPACDFYAKQENGTYQKQEDLPQVSELAENGFTLQIVGIIQPKEDAANADLTGTVAYLESLTEYLIDYTAQSEVVQAQQADSSINVLTGVAFTAADDTQKAADAKEYLSGLSTSQKASLYSMILYYQSQQEDSSQQTASAGIVVSNGMSALATDETAQAKALDAWLNADPDTEILLDLYDQYLSDSSYEDNLDAFGVVSYDAPSSISLYTDSFEDKDGVSACIERYNDSASQENQITYTDYVALLTSSVTSMVNVVSYVLIAFVGVSLIVSCIMIGIITHISVLERTKEIGILRALGASKRNISQVFNAETVIIGFCAGLLGVAISILLTFPINAVIASLLGVGAGTVQASLPALQAAALVLISVAITVVGGLIPAKKAAKKDPVVALRSE